MARRKDEFEMAEAEAVKAVRTAVRLKYQLMADRELNDILPDVQAQVRYALANGKPWHLDPAKVFTEDDAGNVVVIEGN